MQIQRETPVPKDGTYSKDALSEWTIWVVSDARDS